ncbi:cell wall lytic activity [Paenibacillus ginsengarvi]|uniref:Cell wall lytic activity n=1 Tax=Paenibacillus ginsengarvi TaxID=400777 RepID=A0A3B0AXG6_9BACL|nr:cell wall lytic activity [Paenibacillus ginsengarvi]
MGAGQASANGAGSEVKVQVNDALVAFPETQPFIDVSGQTLVPARPLFEAMGYKLDWRMNNGQIAVLMQNADHTKTIEAETGKNEWKVDGKPVKLTSAAMNKQGTLFIPVRAVSELLGSIVQWDADNDIAIIGQDGKYHAPAWYAPPAPAPAAAAVAAAYTPTVADKVASTAQNLLGIRYVWGGTTTKGFDCSGFVNYVFDQYGVELPRTSLDMYDNVGQSVIGLQTGDLVFFKIGKSTTHVGIYLGDGQFVSATTSSGTKIDSVYSSYWGSKYIGAKRVL